MLCSFPFFYRWIMTIQEAIARIDDLKPNAYDVPHKMSWLSEVDGKIYNEVISYHDDDTTWQPYDVTTTELIAKEPYSELYIYYMAAMIDYWNGDTQRYNNDMQMFNDAYRGFTDNYIKKHKSTGYRKFKL